MAIVLSILVAKLALSQTQELHEDNHDLAVEDYERQRFDAMFAANDRVLESVADLKADVLVYLGINNGYLEDKFQSGESVDYLVTVHRSLEQLFARRKSLDVALAGLPDRSEPGQVSNAALAEKKEQLLYASSWLLGCAMASYHSHVTQKLETEDDALATSQAVVNHITSNLDRTSFPSLEIQKSYSRAATKDWQGVAKGAAEDRVGNGKGSALTAAQVATRFLNEAEDKLHIAAKELATEYTTARYATALAVRSRRRSNTWLNSAPYKSRG